MNQLVKVQNPKIHHIPQSLKIFPWFSMVFPWFSYGFPSPRRCCHCFKHSRWICPTEPRQRHGSSRSPLDPWHTRHAMGIHGMKFRLVLLWFNIVHWFVRPRRSPVFVIIFFCKYLLRKMEMVGNSHPMILLIFWMKLESLTDHLSRTIAFLLSCFGLTVAPRTKHDETPPLKSRLTPWCITQNCLK